MRQEISLTSRVETYPVVTTGKRWLHIREREEGGPENYFRMFPECRDDPRRNDFGSVKDFPAPFAKGGGFFPVLTLMNDGRLCCAVRTGAPHAGSGSEISVSFSEDRGKSWSDYRVVVRGDPGQKLDPRNPALAQSEDGHLVLVYGTLVGFDAHAKRAEPPETVSYLEWMDVIRSSDGGKTWSEPRRVYSPEGTLLHPHGQMRKLADGTLVFNARGFYNLNEREKNPDLPERISYLYRSGDGGLTWEQPTLIGPGASETGFLALDQDHWVGYVRHNDRPNSVAHSFDGGKTWDKWSESGDWRALNSRVRRPAPGSVALLPDGKVLITYGYRAYPFGVRAIVSHDGGNTFDTEHEYILSDTGYCSDCGYPSTICYGDGSIVTVDYSVMDIDHPEWGTCCMAFLYHQDLFS